MAGIDYSDGSAPTGSTALGEKMMPGGAEINEDPEFSAADINAEEFEQVWRRATQGAE
jgi:hypothetical protein